MNLLHRVRKARGFTLLIAVIFVSVFLALALAIGSLGYKQSVLASVATESQFAFYAADAAMECALYYDEQKTAAQDPFSYVNHGNAISLQCGPASVTPTETCYNGGNGNCVAGQRITTVRIPIAYTTPNDSNSGETRCADVTVYKTQSGAALSTYLFSQGYNVSCTAVAAGQGRIVARGLQINY